MSIEDEFEDMRKTINRMLKDAFDGKLGVFREPFVYGFTMRSRETRGDGAFQAVEGEEMIRSRDPLPDVQYSPGWIHITAEMPGARDETVRIRSDGQRLVLEGEGDRRYSTVLDLPEDADRASLESTFHNGVLDVTLKRGKPVPQV